MITPVFTLLGLDLWVYLCYLPTFGRIDIDNMLRFQRRIIGIFFALRALKDTEVSTIVAIFHHGIVDVHRTSVERSSMFVSFNAEVGIQT